MEKKQIKINLTTFLLILAIIIICAMGYFTFKFYKEKTSQNKTVEDLNNQISNLENTIDKFQEKMNTISNIVPTEEETTKTNTSVTEKNTNVQNTTPSSTNNKNYDKYIGKWYDSTKDSELVVDKIQNNKITFSWALYRAAVNENITLNLENDKFEFYFDSYEDTNNDGSYSENEKVIRKAIAELKENSIVIIVKNVNTIENNSKYINDFDGTYVPEGTFIYNIK